VTPLTKEELGELAALLRNEAQNAGCAGVIVLVASQTDHYVAYSHVDEGMVGLAEKAVGYLKDAFTKAIKEGGH
jgi:hypothetical protein